MMKADPAVYFVYRNGIRLGAGDDYELDNKTKTIKLTRPTCAGDLICVHKVTELSGLNKRVVKEWIYSAEEGEVSLITNL